MNEKELQRCLGQQVYRRQSREKNIGTGKASITRKTGCGAHNTNTKAR